MNWLSKSTYLLSLTTVRAFSFHANHKSRIICIPLDEMGLRRSPRLRTLNSKSVDDPLEAFAMDDKPKAKRRRKSSNPAVKKEKTTIPSANKSASLPRKLEQKFDCHVIGIDEAGRGPIAGPVVAAAVIFPKDQESLDGINDSKTITKEEEREKLYEALISTPNIRWAACVIDARRIDEINILQATLEAMRYSATALIESSELPIRQVSEATVNEDGCYVVTPGILQRKIEPSSNSKDYFALIDGNKVPSDMPCLSESVVKGDGREYVIAAASVLAKVTRDRLMHGYSELYPEFGLSRHKGYPTAAHVLAIQKFGISPIHRRSFAPIKSMDLGDETNDNNVGHDVFHGNKCTTNK